MSKNMQANKVLNNKIKSVLLFITKRVLPLFAVILASDIVSLFGSIYCSSSLLGAFSNEIVTIANQTDEPILCQITAPDASDNYESAVGSYYKAMDRYRYKASTEIFRSVFFDSAYKPTLTKNDGSSFPVSIVESKPFEDVNYNEISQGQIKLIKTSSGGIKWDCLNDEGDQLFISDIFAKTIMDDGSLTTYEQLFEDSFSVEYLYVDEMKPVASFSIGGIFSTNDNDYTSTNYGSYLTSVYGNNVALTSYSSAKALPGLSLMIETTRTKELGESLSMLYKTIGNVARTHGYDCTFQRTNNQKLRESLLSKENSYNTFRSSFSSWWIKLILVLLAFAFMLIELRLSFYLSQTLYDRCSRFSCMFAIACVSLIPLLLSLLIGKLIGGIALAGFSNYPVLGDNQNWTIIESFITTLVLCIYSRLGFSRTAGTYSISDFSRLKHDAPIYSIDL